MAYETLLTLPVNLAALAYSSVGPTSGYDLVFFTDAACTLGNLTGDLAVIVNLNTGVNSDGATLSAATGSITLTLSSASRIPTPVVISNGYLAASTYNGTVSGATATIKFTEPNFLNTSISVSANKTTTVMDPTKTSVIDNLIWASINPAESGLGIAGLRTAYGNARLAAQQG